MGLRNAGKFDQQGNNPKDRYGLAKVPFSLIPGSALSLLALGLKEGAKKYGEFNWRVEPVQGRVYLEAAIRHLILLLDGEDFDRDTGIHHIAFALSTAAIYADALLQGRLIDNRALPGRTGDLVALFNERPGDEARSPAQNRALFQQLLFSQRDITHDIIELAPAEAFEAIDALTETQTPKKGKRHARR